MIFKDVLPSEEGHVIKIKLIQNLTSVDHG